MILSDIDVHREQTAGAASYFKVDKPAVLAKYLLYAMQESGPPIIRDLQPNLDERVAAFAADFARTIQNAMRKGASRQPRLP